MQDARTADGSWLGCWKANGGAMQDCGLRGLTDRSRRPYRQQLPTACPASSCSCTMSSCRVDADAVSATAPHRIGLVFAGQIVGTNEVSDQVWLVSFMQHDLGIFDQETGPGNQRRNPFRAKVLPMCPE